jgi:hypothetical protein
MNMEKDPRQFKFPVCLTKGAGVATIRAGSIRSIQRSWSGALYISMEGESSIYVEETEHLYADLLRKMFECEEYAEREARKAGSTIQ